EGAQLSRMAQQGAVILLLAFVTGEFEVFEKGWIDRQYCALFIKGQHIVRQAVEYGGRQTIGLLRYSGGQTILVHLVLSQNVGDKGHAQAYQKRPPAALIDLRGGISLQ